MHLENQLKIHGVASIKHDIRIKQFHYFSSVYFKETVIHRPYVISYSLVYDL
jgi:hypothetical protein